jgi:hypothetical protein
MICYGYVYGRDYLNDISHFLPGSSGLAEGLSATTCIFPVLSNSSNMLILINRILQSCMLIRAIAYNYDTKRVLMWEEDCRTTSLFLHQA